MRVGFVGVGTMGRHMAANLQAGGHDLVVHDALPEAAAERVAAGATWAATPAELAAASEVIFTSLPGPAEVEAVATGPNGLLDGAEGSTAWFDLSTNSPTVVRRLHERFAGIGVELLDAPVSGGPRGAESGRLAVWVGGDRATFDRHLPVLRAFSDEPYHVGPIGAGSAAKLVHNCAGYVLQTALAEVFTLGVKAGVDPVELWKAVRHGAIGRRRTFDGLADQFLVNRFDPPSFALRLAHKDVSLATQLGRELGVPMRLANLTLEEMTEALGRGWGLRDSRVAMLLQEERSGVEIEAAREALRAVFEEDPEVTAPASSGSSTHEIYVVKYGQYVGTRGHYFYGTAKDPHEAPVPIDYYVWLLRGPSGDVVVDVGFRAESGTRRGRTHLRPPAEGLAALGVDCDRVEHVILSHFHYDHIGDLSPFPAARFVVQDREMAFWTGRYAARREFRVVVEAEDVVEVVRANFARRVRWVDGDAEVVPGVSVHHVGGHTPGMQVVTVDTARGTVVLAIDAAHFYANLDGDAPFATLHDLAGMYGAFDRLHELAGRDGLIVPGHDPEVLQRFSAVAGLEGIAARIA